MTTTRLRQNLAIIGLASAAAAAWGGPASAAAYTFTTIDVPSALGFNTAVSGINNAGELIGSYYISPTGPSRGPPFEIGFTYAAGQFTPFTTNLAYTYGQGINNLGQVTADVNNGTASRGSVVGQPGHLVEVSVSDLPIAPYTHIHGINDLGQAVGNAATLSGDTGYVLDVASQQLTRLAVPGEPPLNAEAINNASTVAGYYGPGISSPSQGFVLKGANFTTIDAPGAASTAIHGINTAGVLAGDYLLNFNLHTYGYGQTHGFVDDNNVFTTLDVPGASFTDVEGVNDLGQVAGTYQDATGTHGFVATPVTAVPEPASVTLFGAGVAAMGLALAWRRRMP